jgi:hypothetical protein
MSRKLGQTTKRDADSINLKIGFLGAFQAIQQQLCRSCRLHFAVPFRSKPILLVGAEWTPTV